MVSHVFIYSEDGGCFSSVWLFVTLNQYTFYEHRFSFHSCKPVRVELPRQIEGTFDV